MPEVSILCMLVWCGIVLMEVISWTRYRTPASRSALMLMLEPRSKLAVEAILISGE